MTTQWIYNWSRMVRMRKLEARVAPKIKMRGKGKPLMRVFQTSRTTLRVRAIKENQNQRRRSHWRGIRGARGKGQVTHRRLHQAHHQLHHQVWSHLQMMKRREVNLNLRNIKQAIWTKLCFMYRMRRRNTSITSLKNCWNMQITI